MRIMYWISDLCSSDLLRHAPGRPQRRGSLRPDGGVERAHRDRHSHRRGDRRLQGSRSGGAAGAHCAWSRHLSWGVSAMTAKGTPAAPEETPFRSEEHTSELQSLMRNSYAVFCLKKKKLANTQRTHTSDYTHTIT